MKKQTNKYGESFTITPYLVLRILKAVRSLGCKWIIAPYEADAQLTYLFKTGQADVVFTEDSDLIAYGVTKLLYRLDNDGEGYEIDMEGLFWDDLDFSDKVRSIQEITDVDEIKDQDVICINDNSEYSQKDNHSSGSQSSKSQADFWYKDVLPIFSKDKFLALCILAGWDYLEPIKGIGFKTAYKLINEHKTIENVVKEVTSAKKYSVPANYIQNYHLATMTFLFQVVYDYEKEVCVNLTDPKSDDFYGKYYEQWEDKTFLGEFIDSKLAKQVSLGEIDNRTKLEVDMDKLFLEFKELNDPLSSLASSDNDEIQIILEKDVVEIENKPILMKKSSVQKKICFKDSGDKSARKRIPSPYKNKIVGNMKNLSTVKDLNKKRKRTFKQLCLIEKDKQGESECSDMEEDIHSNSLMGLFKRAKKRENNSESVNIFIPKLQTIKKKTFMRSLASSKLN